MTDADTTTDRDPARPGCEVAQAALQRLLDRDAPWDSPEAAAHRTGCIACRDELALAHTLTAVPREVVVPSGLSGRIVTGAIKSDRRRRMARYAAIGGALAASVVAATILLQPPAQTITERPSVAMLPRPKDQPAPTRPLGESVSEARDALVSLTRRTANETRDTSVSLIPNPKLPDMPTAGDRLEPLANAPSSAAKSVEPIKTSAQRAVNLFLRAADPPNRPTVQ